MGRYLMPRHGAAVFSAGLSSLLLLYTPLAARSPSSQGAAARDLTDLDALMARVLERRDESWRRLHEYILSEKERFDIRDPEGQPLYGGRREYMWYIRDGYFIRSPLRFNGVTITEEQRRSYERRWLDEERRRHTAKAEERAEAPAGGDAPDDMGEVETLAAKGLEPRFISQAYFLDFKFEPGNYYYAGRETLEGRDVLRVEYYPSRLFQDERQTQEQSRDEREFVRKLNKVAVITLWVDPKEEQIVKYTFDNTGYEFFPLRWLVRVDEVSASMVMAPYLRGFWVPTTITAHASFTVAHGTVEVEYGREFFDYRKAETGARMRVGGVVER
ncbi:MAG: hypothetical protein ACRD2X_21440 [Vicinamibacteraceae bacterium]